MTNLTIEFTNSPWLLFVLIPVIAVALIPYFRFVLPVLILVIIITGLFF